MKKVPLFTLVFFVVLSICVGLSFVWRALKSDPSVQPSTVSTGIPGSQLPSTAPEKEKSPERKVELPSPTVAQGLPAQLGHTISKQDEKTLKDILAESQLSEEDKQTILNWMKQYQLTAFRPLPVAENDTRRFVLEGGEGEPHLTIELQKDEQGNWNIKRLVPKSEGAGDQVIDKEDTQETRQDTRQGEKPLDQPEEEETPAKTNTEGMAPSERCAYDFIEHLSALEIGSARSMVHGKQVSETTLAGLCMVFSEGGYRLRPSKPVRCMFENDDRAGYLVYLVGGTETKPSQVGIEMQKIGDDWRVTALGMDSLLSAYEEAAAAEGGRFFPLVKNPRGGDSLVLYFAFDDSSLTPRSVRQLEIVASLLKENQRQLEISGHTDDVGGFEYNKALSARRADAVQETLIGFGVKRAQIRTRAMGKNEPRRTYAGVEEEKLDTVRAENRRAEIYLDFQ